MGQPQAFVSYSHKDEDFAQRLADDLRAAGVQVWMDKAGISHGNFMQRIDEALLRCDWMVLVLTPNAMTSEYVKQEVYTALNRVQQKAMRDVIPVLAAPCAPGTIPPQWDALHRYDATRNYAGAVAGILRALGLSPVPAPSEPLTPGARQPGSARQVPRTYHCSFCGKERAMVERLIAGPSGAYICNECVELCQEIIDEERADARKIRSRTKDY